MATQGIIWSIHSIHASESNLLSFRVAISGSGFSRDRFAGGNTVYFGKSVCTVLNHRTSDTLVNTDQLQTLHQSTTICIVSWLFYMYTASSTVREFLTCVVQAWRYMTFCLQAMSRSSCCFGTA